MIRLGTKDDIPEIVRMGSKFYDESNFEVGGYDAEQFAFVLNHLFQVNSHHCLIAETDKPIGFIIFDMAKLYTKYYVAHMLLMYVEDRTQGAGKKLIQAATNYAKENECKYFYGSSSAGFNDNGKNDKALQYMYEKQGFEGNGIFMRKTLNE